MIRFRTWGCTAVALLLLTACSRQTAEEKGAALATEKIDMVKGIGTALESKGSAAAESLTGGLGKVVQGAEKGVLKSGRTVVLTPATAQHGLAVSKVQDAGSAAQGTAIHGLEAYVMSRTAVDGQLKVTLYDALDREIGRTRLPIKLVADDAGYQTIEIDKRITLSDISKVSIDYQPSVVGAVATQK